MLFPLLFALISRTGENQGIAEMPFPSFVCFKRYDKPEDGTTNLTPPPFPLPSGADEVRADKASPSLCTVKAAFPNEEPPSFSIKLKRLHPQQSGRIATGRFLSGRLSFARKPLL